MHAVCSASVSYFYSENDSCHANYPKSGGLIHVFTAGRTLVGDKSEIMFFIPTSDIAMATSFC